MYAILTSTLLHGTYDYFLFISFVPGIWIWSFISLVITFFLAKQAIRIHQTASPFIHPPSDNANENKN